MIAPWQHMVRGADTCSATTSNIPRPSSLAYQFIRRVPRTHGRQDAPFGIPGILVAAEADPPGLTAAPQIPGTAPQYSVLEKQFSVVSKLRDLTVSRESTHTKRRIAQLRRHCACEC